MEESKEQYGLRKLCLDFEEVQSKQLRNRKLTIPMGCPKLIKKIKISTPN